MSGVKKASAAPENEVEAAASTMPAMGTANGGNAAGMAGRCKPVVDGGTNPSPLDRRVARPMMPGDQQQDTVAGRNRSFQGDVDRVPCPVEVHAMKIDNPVRLDRALAQCLVPAAVERRSDLGRGCGTR